MTLPTSSRWSSRFIRVSCAGPAKAPPPQRGPSISRRLTVSSGRVRRIWQIDLNDVVVTGDALFAQRALCAYIVEQGGQYVFEVKDNQPTLLQALQHSFRDDAPGARGRAND